MIRASFVCIYREVAVDEDVGSTDIPGLHPEPGGQGRCASLLECVAIIEAGGNENGCTSGCTLHASQGMKTNTQWTQKVHYCPQSFSGGGLYLKVNWLLWSVYDGLL